MIFESDLITLRPITTSDYPQLMQVLNHGPTMQALESYFGADPWTLDRVRKRYQNFQNEETAGRGYTFAVVLKKDQSVVGNCGFKNLDRVRKESEFGIIIHQQVWGTRVARDCHLLCLEYAFGVLNLRRVYFSTDVQNSRMIGFFRKNKVADMGVTAEKHLLFEVRRSDWPKVKASLLI